MTREEAREILDSFIMEDIDNNHNFSEDTHKITWVGMNFAVLEISTGTIHTFKLTIGDSDLSVQQWTKAFEKQEWIEEGQVVNSD